MIGVIFDIENRCDPVVLECPKVSIGSSVIFEEDFTDLKIKDLEELTELSKDNPSFAKNTSISLATTL